MQALIESQKSLVSRLEEHISVLEDTVERQEKLITFMRNRQAKMLDRTEHQEKIINEALELIKEIKESV